MAFDLASLTFGDALSVAQICATVVIVPLMKKIDGLKLSNDTLSASLSELRIMIHKDFVSYEALERLEREGAARSHRRTSHSD